MKKRFIKGGDDLKVLVTGGAGFIGSHVVEELLSHQYEVVVIDNLITGRNENITNEATVYHIDINDPRLEEIFQTEKPDYVIHLAAQASVSVSMDNPYLDFSTNTIGTVKLLLLSQEYHVKKFLFASTAAVYGEPSYLPVDEKHPINPQSFYSLSKYSAESYIKCNGMINGLNSCILRFSNVYGPRQNANGEAGVISIFINNILEEKDIYIYDGTQTRDFVYVKDVAKACRFAMEGAHQGVFNISSCTETSINELYSIILKMVGTHKTVIYKPLRIGEITNSVLDNEKVSTEFNWRTQYSLIDGLGETLSYYANTFTHEHSVIK